MFFKEKNICVDFTVSEISDYAAMLNAAIEKASECYAETMKWSDKIAEALCEIIEVGNQNLQACEAQLQWCEEQKDVAQNNIRVLEDVSEQISKNIYLLDEDISKANTAYTHACQESDKIRNRSAKSPEEEKVRQRSLSAARSQVNHYNQLLSKLREKRSRLFQEKNSVDADISTLRNIHDIKLYQIDLHLQQEKNRIKAAIMKAESLRDSLTASVQTLQTAFHNDIENHLGSCCTATGNALACANDALACMSVLNNRSYTNYDRITVNNVAAMQTDAIEMIDTLKKMIRQFQQIYGLCKKYGEMLQDNIMDASLSLLENLSEEERRSLSYIAKKSMELDNFCNSLLHYCGQKM